MSHTTSQQLVVFSLASEEYALPIAVPELVSRMEAASARRVRLDAALVGGASMFAVAPTSLEVGQRNDAAVREQLASLRIPVRADATGGSRGRTIRVDVATGTTTFREVGGQDTELLAGTLETAA